MHHVVLYGAYALVHVVIRVVFWILILLFVKLGDSNAILFNQQLKNVEQKPECQIVRSMCSQVPQLT